MSSLIPRFLATVESQDYFADAVAPPQRLERLVEGSNTSSTLVKGRVLVSRASQPGVSGRSSGTTRTALTSLRLSLAQRRQEIVPEARVRPSAVMKANLATPG